jgi:PAS domain-containing protein
MADVQQGLEWASWIVTRRAAIERALALRMGERTPSPASPESEALRRFRSFVATALRRGGGGDVAPALDGLRVDPALAEQALEAWCRAAADVAGARGTELRALLAPLAARFQGSLTGAHVVRSAPRAARAVRRAVAGAIDRVADAFLAIDLDDERVVDANPAASALLRTPRETLVGADARRFVHSDSRITWHDELAELVESDEPRRFRAIWLDALARPMAVEAHVTRYVRRGRVLALVLARVL